MRFNKSVYKLLMMSGMAILLAACSAGPRPIEQASKEEPADSAAEMQQEGGDRSPPPGLDLSAPDTNPYLAQSREAPAEAKAAFARAVQAMQAAQWLEAESELKQITAEYPQLSGPFLNLGIVYRELNHAELAEEAFQQAIAVNPQNLEAYNQLAVLKREAGDFNSAEQHYLAALNIWPKHAASHRNLAILYDLYMGELAKALQHFEIYQYLQPEEDRELAGWIIDLKRRMAESNSGEQR